MIKIQNLNYHLILLFCLEHLMNHLALNILMMNFIQSHVMPQLIQLSYFWRMESSNGVNLYYLMYIIRDYEGINRLCFAEGTYFINFINHFTIISAIILPAILFLMIITYRCINYKMEGIKSFDTLGKKKSDFLCLKNISNNFLFWII